MKFLYVCVCKCLAAHKREKGEEVGKEGEKNEKERKTPTERNDREKGCCAACKHCRVLLQNTGMANGRMC